MEGEGDGADEEDGKGEAANNSNGAMTELSSLRPREMSMCGIDEEPDHEDLQGGGDHRQEEPENGQAEEAREGRRRAQQGDDSAAHVKLRQGPRPQREHAGRRGTRGKPPVPDPSALKAMMQARQERPPQPVRSETVVEMAKRQSNNSNNNPDEESDHSDQGEERQLVPMSSPRDVSDFHSAFRNAVERPEIAPALNFSPQPSPSPNAPGSLKSHKSKQGSSGSIVLVTRLVDVLGTFLAPSEGSEENHEPTPSASLGLYVADCRELFERTDTDGDGLISKHELAALLGIGRAEARGLIAEAKANPDIRSLAAVATWREFLRLITNQTRPDVPEEAMAQNLSRYRAMFEGLGVSDAHVSVRALASSMGIGVGDMLDCLAVAGVMAEHDRVSEQDFCRWMACVEGISQARAGVLELLEARAKRAHTVQGSDLESEEGEPHPIIVSLWRASSPEENDECAMGDLEDTLTDATERGELEWNPDDLPELLRDLNAQSDDGGMVPFSAFWGLMDQYVNWDQQRDTAPDEQGLRVAFDLLSQGWNRVSEEGEEEESSFGEGDFATRLAARLTDAGPDIDFEEFAGVVQQAQEEAGATSGMVTQALQRLSARASES